MSAVSVWGFLHGLVVGCRTEVSHRLYPGGLAAPVPNDGFNFAGPGGLTFEQCTPVEICGLGGVCREGHLQVEVANVYCVDDDLMTGIRAMPGLFAGILQERWALPGVSFVGVDHSPRHVCSHGWLHLWREVGLPRLSRLLS